MKMVELRIIKYELVEGIKLRLGSVESGEIESGEGK